MFTLPWTSTRGIYLNNWLAMNLTFKFYLTGTGWIQYIPSTSPPLLKLGLLIFWLNNSISDSIWLSFLREFDYIMLASLLLCLTASKISILIWYCLVLAFWRHSSPGLALSVKLFAVYVSILLYHPRSVKSDWNSFTLPTIKTTCGRRSMPHYMIHIIS